MRRGDIFWADLPPPLGRRPALIVTRTRALRFRTRVTVAPLTTTIRRIESEVALGPEEGLPTESVANCDDLDMVPRAWLDPEPIGRLDITRISDLDQALRFALGIRY